MILGLAKIAEVYFSTTVGRDKVFRFIQYFSRFVSNTIEDKMLIEKLKSVISSASTTRKWLRLFRLDFYTPLLSFIEGNRQIDSVLQNLDFIRNISMQLFFYCDHALLFNTLKLYTPSKDVLAQLKKSHMKFWAIGIMLNMLKHLHVYSIYPKKKQDKKSFIMDHKKFLMDFIDLLIPLTSLGYLKFSDSHVGIFGSITALNGAYEQYKKVNI